MLVTLDDWFSSMVVSMLVKSTCKRSRGVVAMIGCRGALDKLPLCCKQCTQVLMDYCIWLVIPSHQKHSCNRDRVQSWPWYPISLWHPFRVVTQCTFGTTKSRRSSFSPLGIECRYRAFWWIMKFCQFHKISWPSSLEACCPKSVFSSVFFGLPTSQKCTQHWIFPLGFYPISHMHLDQHAPCSNTDLLLQVMDTLNYGGVINFCPMCSLLDYSIKDGSHHVWVTVGSNLAQHICHSVIISFLAL